MLELPVTKSDFQALYTQVNSLIFVLPELPTRLPQLLQLKICFDQLSSNNT